jgi:hypothetical protein
MNQQPKTSYQDFLKDIYSAMKKINQTTGDIFAKLDMLDTRIANLEKSYVLISEDVKKLIPNTNPHSNSGISPAKQTGASKLLSLLTQLNDSENDIADTGMDVYTLGTNTALETVFTNPKPSPLFNMDGLHSPDTEDNYSSVTADISPVRLQIGSNITQNNTVCTGLQAQCNATGVTHNSRPPEVGLEFSVSGMQDDFMILE